jgi:hypothetical protein
MPPGLSDTEIQAYLDRYHAQTDWSDLEQTVAQTGEAVQLLAEGLVTHNEAGISTTELTTLYRLCEIPSSAGASKKRERVEDLDLPDDIIGDVVELIDDNMGIVGGGKGQLKVPTGAETATYDLLDTLVTSSDHAELDAAIEAFADAEIAGIQAGTLSPIFFFLHPTYYPVINGRSRDGLEALTGESVSGLLTNYTTEAQRYRDFRDTYGPDRGDGHLRDLDWFLHLFSEGELDPDTTTTTTTTSDSTPTVWVEKTDIHGPYKQPGSGELSLGRAVFSPQADSAGKDIYWALRDADPGDIVLHILQDDEAIVGASVVTSDLITDYDFPPAVEQRWEPSQREQGGYLRRLQSFEQFDAPVDLQADLFDHPAREPKVDRIREEYSNLFYNKNHGFVQGGYLTKAPEPLVDVLTDASSELQTYLATHGYPIDDTGGGGKDSGGEDGEVTYYFWNTNYHHEGTDGQAAFKRGVAAAYGDYEYGEKLTKPSPGDVLLAYRVEHGLIGAGTVIEATDGTPLSKPDPDSDTDPIKGPDKLEFHLPVDWEYTLSEANAISLETIRETLDIDKISHVATIQKPTNQAGAADLREAVRDRYIDAHSESPGATHSYSDLQRQLEAKKQLIFHGPPGTGKTYTARRFANWYRAQADANAVGVEQVRTVTFHPSVSYEDFVEGFTASVQGEDGGQVAYDYTEGAFASIVADARDAYEQTPRGETPPPFFLIIDEINRGNLAQILGETITLLEADKRLDAPEEVTAQLAHSGRSFTVPPNLYLIGTMNTADESIALIDTALRRRFRFFEFPPNFDTITATTPDLQTPTSLEDVITSGGGGARTQLLAASILALEDLNEEILDIQQLGKGKQLGHTYLFDCQTPSDIVDTWRFELLPQLVDYYFGQFDALQADLFSNVSHSVLDTTQNSITDFTASELYQCLCDLAGIPEQDRQPLTT